MSKTALITGASSGIGAAFARALVKEGYHVVLVARRVQRLEELAAELKTSHPNVRAEVVPADLLNPGAAAEILQAVTDRGLSVDLLINNAGMGIHGAFAEAAAEDDARMIALNITSLTALTRAFLPGMLERGAGGILNVASTAAFQPIPFFAVYAATKAYVLSFSEGLAEEVAGRGVKVTCLCPGPTETEFNAVSGVGELEMAKRAPAMSAEAVVAEGLAALRAGRPVQVAGFMNAVGASATRLVPRQWLAKAAGMIFKPSH
jgi:hypothetical protein